MTNLTILILLIITHYHSLSLTKCVVCVNSITIPSGDQARCKLFGDPIFNVLKHIKVDDGDKVTLYNDKTTVVISVDNYRTTSPPLLKPWHLNFATVNQRLEFIHNNMLFSSGQIRDEYPKQFLITKYLTPNAKVLELGANYARSTLTIAALLDDETNLVTLECDQTNADVAKTNRDLNNYKFKLEVAALSARKLFQKVGIPIPRN